MRRQILGGLFLGYRAVVVHPLRRILGLTGPEGKEAFLANYAPEGLAPTSPDDRAHLEAASRCISCGLCDAFDGLLGSRALGSYDGVSLLPRQYGRSSVEWTHLRAFFDAVEPEAYREAEKVCPTRVPLVALAYWLREKVSELPAPVVASEEGEAR